MQISLEALADLLNSVDHDKVVTSKDAVISDEALLALLDRSFSSSKQNQDVGSQKTKHTEVFKVLEESDEKGNILHNLETEPESNSESLSIRSTSSDYIQNSKPNCNTDISAE